MSLGAPEQISIKFLTVSRSALPIKPVLAKWTTARAGASWAFFVTRARAVPDGVIDCLFFGDGSHDGRSD